MLNMGLRLGGVMMSVVSPSKGTVTEMPADFAGTQNVNITSLEINDFVIVDTPLYAPFHLIVRSIDVSFIGSRTLSTNAVLPFLDFEYNIVVTKANGDPLPDYYQYKKPNTDIPLNLFTDRKEPIFHHMIPLDGGIMITVTAKAKNGAGMVRVASLSKTITIAKNPLPHYWADSVNGNAANDKLGPWETSGITGATYNDSTRQLSGAGIAANYDHVAATAHTNPLYHYKYIYLKTANEAGFVPGLREIASKIDDNTFELAESIGLDLTNVSSSTGPIPQPDATSNLYWKITGDFRRSPFAASLVRTYLIGYRGGYRLLNDGTGTHVLYGGHGGGSSSPAEHQFVMANYTIDGEWSKGCIGISQSSTGGGKTNILFTDGEIKNSSSSTLIGMILDSKGTFKRRLSFIGNVFNALTRNRVEYTVANATAGNDYVDVAEDITIDTPASGDIRWRTNTGRTIKKSYSSHSGVGTKRFYLTSAIAPIDAEHPDPTSDGKLLVASESQPRAYSVNPVNYMPDCDTALIANTFLTDCDADDEHHDLYLSGFISNSDVSYNNFSSGIGSSYAWNGNLKATADGTLNYQHSDIVFCRNYISADRRFGFDMSITNFEHPLEYANNVLVVGNESHVFHCFSYYGSAETIRFGQNIDIDTAGLNNNYSLFASIVKAQGFGSGDRFHAIIDDNTIVNRAVAKYDGGETELEITNNNNSNDGDRVCLDISSSTYENGAITGNNFDNPNQSNGYVAEIDGIGYTLEDFNTEVDGVNTADPTGPKLTEVFADDFNRSDQQLSDSSNWLNRETSSGNALQIASEIVVIGTNNAARSNYAIADLEPNQYSKALVVTTGSSSIGYVLCRVSASANTFYGAKLLVNTTTGEGVIQAQKYVEGVSALLGSPVALTGLSGNSLLEMRVTQAAIEEAAINIYVDGEPKFSVTDADSPIMSGFAGIRLFQNSGSTARIDNFSCGNIT